MATGIMLASFPETAFGELTNSDEKLFETYCKIVERGRVIESATSRRTEYSNPNFRQIFCRAAIALNQRQLLAPAARPQIAISYNAAKLLDAEKLISNDRQVIDLHWLWRNGYQQARCTGPAYRSIFDPNKFDVERAWAFVSRVGTTKLKVEKLALGIGEQLRLASLRGPAARSESKAINEDVQKFRNAICSLNGPAKINPERWAMVRKADLIAASDGRDKPKAAAVIKIYRWLTADGATSDAALRKTVKKVRAYSEKLGSAR